MPRSPMFQLDQQIVIEFDFETGHAMPSLHLFGQARQMMGGVAEAVLDDHAAAALAVGCCAERVWTAAARSSPTVESKRASSRSRAAIGWSPRRQTVLAPVSGTAAR